jgi:hypothetical protein
MRRVILTPIARTRRPKGKPDSLRDFKEQQLRTALGSHIWMWDDAAGNQANVGDVFGFVHNHSVIIYHIVTEVKDPQHRLPSWTANIGQRDRNVLYLSEEVGRQSWEEWCEIGGYDKVQGTMYVKKEELKTALLYLF